MTTVGVPETDLARIRRWVDAQNERIGEHIDEMRVEMDVDPRAVTILECRPPWREDFGPEWTRQEIARLRYTKSTGSWAHYWPDRNSKFHRYEDLDPTPTVDQLLAEIDADPVLRAYPASRLRLTDGLRSPHPYSSGNIYTSVEY